MLDPWRKGVEMAVQRGWLRRLALVPLAVLLLAIALPIALVFLAAWLVVALLLQVVVWTTWCPRGRIALVVYSDSPVWGPYFVREILPAVGKRGVVLNWSERKRWKWSLPVALFQVFAGGREFNPAAIVFRPLRWPQRFRFYQAFRAMKHGKPEEVEEMRRRLLELLDRLAPSARQTDTG
jgi:hypothetical protein